MELKYESLADMLHCSREAGEFFASLPPYVQQSIRERGNNVRSMESLRGYADNLLAGDD